MARSDSSRPIEILLVEDNPADVRLTEETLLEGRVSHHLSIAGDGETALHMVRGEGPYANQPRPDLILLDLDLPKLDGRDVLAELKQDPVLRKIPIIVLTTSCAREDIEHSYRLHANCYIAKPVEYGEFVEVIRLIEDFWLRRVQLPGGAD